MKLETGKYYKMRNGEKAYCVGFNLNGDAVVEYVEIGQICLYKGCKYNVVDSQYDIISELMEAEEELYKELNYLLGEVEAKQILSKYKIDYK